MALVIRNFGIVCVLFHCKGAEPEPQTKKPFRSGRKDFGIGSHQACADARYPLPPDVMRSGRGIRAMARRIEDDISSIWQYALFGAIAFVDHPRRLMARLRNFSHLPKSVWSLGYCR